jgi:predicted amidohydrolase
MKVTVIQPNIFWEDKLVNLNDYNEYLSGLSKTDLVVLPEMFTTGFSMNCQLHAESTKANNRMDERLVEEIRLCYLRFNYD